MKKLRKWVKVSAVAVIVLVLAIIFNNSNILYEDENIVVYDKPHLKDNIVVFSIDDVNNLDKSIYDRIEKEFENYSVTLFVMPDNIQSGIERFELAQHADSKEKNNVEEIKSGRKKLEEFGYEVYGYRAPNYDRNNEVFEYLQENYEYDSTMSLNSFKSGDFREIPVRFYDFNNVCHSNWCYDVKKVLIKIEFDLYRIYGYFFDDVLFFNLHFWEIDNYENLNFVHEILKENYQVMSYKQYYDYLNVLDEIEISSEVINDELQINIENDFEGMIIKIKNNRNVSSNVHMECRNNFCLINNHAYV